MTRPTTARRLSGVIVWSLLVVAAGVQAQPAGSTSPRTRAEQLRQMREKRQREAPVPYRAGRLERLMLAIDKAETPTFLDQNFYGLYPRISFIHRGSGVSFGARYWQPQIPVVGLDVHASAYHSVLGYELYDLQIGKLPRPEEGLPQRSWKGDDVYELGRIHQRNFPRWSLYGAVRYRHRPREDFFGVGPDSRRSDHTTFLIYDGTYELVLGYRLTRWAAVGLRGGYLKFGGGSGNDPDFPSIEARFDASTAPGLGDRPEFVRWAPQVFIDFRDEPGNPHRGFMVGVEYAHFDHRNGDDYDFRRIAVDARGFLPLGTPQRILALRTLYFGDQADAGKRVPFYLMESLGGSHTMRGIDSFRFRGDEVLLFQGEYRWEGSPAIELALFTAAGTVAATGAGVRLADLEWEYGYGFRFKNYRTTMFRFDQGFGRERSRIFVRFSASY